VPIDRIDKAIKEHKRVRQVSINAGKVVLKQKNKDLCNCVISYNIIFADGQSIIWASHFLGKDLPCRVAGCDLV
jgi:N-acetylglucosaminyldiphosphoundecaprenol N-acetyl-beta-D-mannosaminyltransferase